VNILITGAGGQLGKALCKSVPAGFSAIAAGREKLDITDSDAVNSFSVDHQIEGIINAAAYTAVDKAEEDVTNARAVNADGPAVLAAVAADLNIHLVHVSTDFVFDGSQGSPYKPDDKTSPLGVYGETKRAGEVAVLETVGISATILRTAWVYDAGGANFVSTMLRLMAEKESLGVVADQIGSPTHTYGLATACWECLAENTTGIRHWSDAGVASWYDFAVAIQEEALSLGLLEKSIPISPITSDQYPTPAARPSYSVLSNSGAHALSAQPNHWRSMLRRVLADWPKA
jgi:dTDP-4-dehydrorhamnose reductase